MFLGLLCSKQRLSLSSGIDLFLVSRMKQLTASASVEARGSVIRTNSNQEEQQQEIF